MPTNKTVTRTTKYPPYLSGNGIVVRVPIVTVVFGVQPFANTAAFPLSSKQNNIFLLSNSVFGFTFNGAVSAYIFLAVIFSVGFIFFWVISTPSSHYFVTALLTSGLVSFWVSTIPRTKLIRWFEHFAACAEARGHVFPPHQDTQRVTLPLTDCQGGID